MLQGTQQEMENRPQQLTMLQRINCYQQLQTQQEIKNRLQQLLVLQETQQEMENRPQQLTMLHEINQPFKQPKVLQLCTQQLRMLQGIY